MARGRIPNRGENRLRRRRVACICASVALIASAPGAVNAAVITDTLSFQTSDQPIWGGADPVFDEILANLPLGSSIGPGNLVADLGPLGQYGIEASLSAGIDIGLLTRLRNFQVGTVDINYPVNVTLDFPDTVSAGETFTISSSFTVDPSAGFTSTANSSELDFAAKASINAGLNLRACIVDCFIDNTDPSSPYYFQRNTDIGTLDLITQTKDNTIINVDLPDIGQPAEFVGKPTIPGSGIDIDPTQDVTVNPVDALVDIAISEATNVSGKITVPDLSQTGSLTGTNTLTGKKTDVFTDVSVDLDSFLSPPLPPLGIGPFTVAGVTFGVDLFDASLVTKLIADQLLEFIGTPKVVLDLGALGTVEFNLGDSVDITAPTDLTGIDITPTYVLDNTFSNQTIVAAAQETDITFGGLEFAFPKIQVLPGTPDIVIPGTPSFCLIPNPFGGCVVRVPAVPSITIPGIDPLDIGPFSFDDAIYSQAITDSLIDANVGGVPISVGVCDVNPTACNALPLLGQDNARNSDTFNDQQSFDFPTFSGPAFRVAVEGTGTVAVPEPSALPLMAVGLGMIAFFWRRRSARA